MSLDLAVKEFEYSRLPRPERIRLLLESIFDSADEIAVVLDRYVDSNFTKLPGTLDATSPI